MATKEAKVVCTRPFVSTVALTVVVTCWPVDSGEPVEITCPTTALGGLLSMEMPAKALFDVPVRVQTSEPLVVVVTKFVV